MQPTVSTRTRRLGWVPDVPDARDHFCAAAHPMAASLPAAIDLRSQCPPVYDQLNLGSCTANAVAGAIQFDQLRQQLAGPFVPSRLFIYYNERAREHTTAVDAGAMIRDGIKSVAAQGVCPETLWPYVDDGATFACRPKPACYAAAAAHKAISYARVPRLVEQMKGCLASGFPFVYGFSVYESFMSDAVASTGVAHLPGPAEQLVGGHAVVAVGYDEAKQVFISRNSWGSGWGLGGYFLMPYAYLLEPNLSDDFWTIRFVR